MRDTSSAVRLPERSFPIPLLRHASSVRRGWQVEELSRMPNNIEAHGLYVRMFRADCGSFIKDLVEELFMRTETFYLRAGSCADR
ncbi:MAG: hypothetical protein PUI88_08855 [Prevotella sp.]|nr:hypothetical protein [Prevotella sp.]